MQFPEEIEKGVGRSEESLYADYGIEVTEPLNGESALILQGDLFSTYDVPQDLDALIEDITYIIEEEIY